MKEEEKKLDVGKILGDVIGGMTGASLPMATQLLKYALTPAVLEPVIKSIDPKMLSELLKVVLGAVVENRELVSNLISGTMEGITEAMKAIDPKVIGDLLVTVVGAVDLREILVLVADLLPSIDLSKIVSSIDLTPVIPMMGAAIPEVMELLIELLDLLLDLLGPSIPDILNALVCAIDENKESIIGLVSRTVKAMGLG
ncbi:MAG: hypothetical protein EF807_08665 [Candidatus Methanolliviera hydrocarbonicum]|uniref:Uncharacterized protein n=1 Tax=Candidatus Methanolliviera hydrocarbonicum TaxID=2491085 RepID=A0A520KUF3_9EURY|nr:MAG: hypothetical protein EF807_08665 [Candidatus Methanolliviera hydrocarbonicum]